VNWLFTAFLTAVSFLILAELPTGLEFDGWQRSVIAAIIFGILNALIRPILKVFLLPIALIFSQFLISLAINTILLLLASALVDGFDLQWGGWSALLAAFWLGVINFLTSKIFGS
jgi:putative membrane protein